MNFARVIRAVFTVLTVVVSTFVGWRAGVFAWIGGAAQARVDLFRHRAVFMGYGMHWGPERVDGETGLPITWVAGCLVNQREMAFAHAYNATVARWIKANGLPRESLRPKMVAEDIARRLVAGGRRLHAGEVEQLGQHRVEYRGENKLFICSKDCTEISMGVAVADELNVARYGEDLVVIGKRGGPIVQVGLPSGLIIEVIGRRPGS